MKNKRQRFSHLKSTSKFSSGSNVKVMLIKRFKINQIQAKINIENNKVKFSQ